MNRRRFLQVAAGSAAFFGLARRGYPFGQSPAFHCSTPPFLGSDRAGPTTTVTTCRF